MRDSIGSLIAFVLTIFSGVGWFYGLYHSAKTQQWFLFTLDFVCPPIGVVHGWGAIAGLW